MKTEEKYRIGYSDEGGISRTCSRQPFSSYSSHNSQSSTQSVEYLDTIYCSGNKLNWISLENLSQRTFFLSWVPQKGYGDPIDTVLAADTPLEVVRNMGGLYATYDWFYSADEESEEIPLSHNGFSVIIQSCSLSTTLPGIHRLRGKNAMVPGELYSAPIVVNKLSTDTSSPARVHKPKQMRIHIAHHSVQIMVPWSGSVNVTLYDLHGRILFKTVFVNASPGSLHNLDFPKHLANRFVICEIRNQSLIRSATFVTK